MHLQGKRTTTDRRPKHTCVNSVARTDASQARHVAETDRGTWRQPLLPLAPQKRNAPVLRGFASLRRLAHQRCCGWMKALIGQAVLVRERHTAQRATQGEGPVADEPLCEARQVEDVPTSEATDPFFHFNGGDTDATLCHRWPHLLGAFSASQTGEVGLLPNLSAADSRPLAELLDPLGNDRVLHLLRALPTAGGAFRWLPSARRWLQSFGRQRLPKVTCGESWLGKDPRRKQIPNLSGQPVGDAHRRKREYEDLQLRLQQHLRTELRQNEANKAENAGGRASPWAVAWPAELRTITATLAKAIHHIRRR
mmetsp:Transcript_32929/g.94576  ORF Transcript_32929/g.94576 Transcript_32929/m.94576 type:complete len:310 (+) Transcript_32929:118-1047(+)